MPEVDDPRVVEFRRVLSADAATRMIGEDVPDLEPTVRGATIAVDPDRGDGGEPVFAYLPVGDVAELRRAVHAMEYGVSGGAIRADGMRNRSRTFGYSPRRPVYRRDWCGVTALAGDYPDQHAVVAGFADRLADVLGEIDPRLLERGRTAAAPVAPEWRLGESKLWTSGVINATARLPYHRDAFNLPAWSAMPVLRRHMDGGYLAIPEYGAVLECRDGWGVFFAGYELLHGVTPMRARRRDGYRYSVVYYALRGMKDCFTAAMETAYARRKRTEREQEMARQLTAGTSTVHNLAPGRGGRSPRQMGGRAVLGGTAYVAKTEDEALADLIEFARLERDAGDIEPWAAILADLRATGTLDDEQALWAVKLYNAYDDFGSAFRVFADAPTVREWVGADRAAAAGHPISQERRNLRGGRLLRHLDSYLSHLDGRAQRSWLSLGVPPDVDPGDGFYALMKHVRAVWGTGRQSAFEWAEFAAKVVGLPIEAPDACLWESSGPRQALERLYGNPDPDQSWLNDRAGECRATLAAAGVDLPWWDFETVICDFNVMRKGRYYPGQHIAMVREEIDSLPEPWRGRLDAALRRVVPAPWSEIAPGADKALRVAYRDTGKITTPIGSAA